MDNEGKFWVAIWRIGAACFCVLVVSIATCTAHGHHKAAELVKSGHSAVEARCAVPNGSDSVAACALSGAKHNHP